MSFIGVYIILYARPNIDFKFLKASSTNYCPKIFKCYWNGNQVN